MLGARETLPYCRARPWTASVYPQLRVHTHLHCTGLFWANTQEVLCGLIHSTGDCTPYQECHRAGLPGLPPPATIASGNTALSGSIALPPLLYMWWTACTGVRNVNVSSSQSSSRKQSCTGVAAHLVCIKHWHSLVPEHVADSAFAHACGACIVSRKAQVVHLAHCFRGGDTATYLCSQSAPGARACWHPAFRTVTLQLAVR